MAGESSAHNYIKIAAAVGQDEREAGTSAFLHFVQQAQARYPPPLVMYPSRTGEASLFNLPVS